MVFSLAEQPGSSFPRRRESSFLSVFLLLFTFAAYADGTLTDNIRISSTVLGYDLQYRVYLPEGHTTRTDHPVLFLTDGQNYLARGKMDTVLNKLIHDGKIEPVVAVFVDPRDPDDTETNRRREQFLCNPEYFGFYVQELIPTIEKDYLVKKSSDARAIMGTSFGGTNAACFGLMGPQFFSMIGMQSPANHPIPLMLPTWQELPTLPFKIFLSTGTPDDNTEANQEFHQLLRDKGYAIKYIEVDEGHNWDNWRPLLDDALSWFYGTSKE